MMLAVDIGNTTIHIGAFERGRLMGDWRITTRPHKTADEYGMAIREFLRIGRLEKSRVDGGALCSVVPILTPVLTEAFQKYFRCRPLVVDHATAAGLKILYDPPRDVGPDRIVNGVAVRARGRGSVIVVDFGTATTFDVISAKGEYLGGVIAPGVMISVEALFSRAAKLAVVQLTPPARVIGRDTVSSVQSGVIFGYAAMVDGMVARIRKEIPGPVRIVATGGLADLIAPHSKTIREIKPFLTLEGLWILYRKNRGRKAK
jgi:type III pantothenate kinase